MTRQSIQEEVLRQITKNGIFALLLCGVCWWTAVRVIEPNQAAYRDYLAKQTEVSARQATILERLSSDVGDLKAYARQGEQSHASQQEALRLLSEQNRKSGG